MQREQRPGCPRDTCSVRPARGVRPPRGDAPSIGSTPSRASSFATPIAPRTPSRRPSSAAGATCHPCATSTKFDAWLRRLLMRAITDEFRASTESSGVDRRAPHRAVDARRLRGRRRPRAARYRLSPALRRAPRDRRPSPLPRACPSRNWPCPLGSLSGRQSPGCTTRRMPCVSRSRRTHGPGDGRSAHECRTRHRAPDRRLARGGMPGRAPGSNPRIGRPSHRSDDISGASSPLWREPMTRHPARPRAAAAIGAVFTAAPLFVFLRAIAVRRCRQRAHRRNRGAGIAIADRPSATVPLTACEARSHRMRSCTRRRIGSRGAAHRLGDRVRDDVPLLATAARDIVLRIDVHHLGWTGR